VIRKRKKEVRMNRPSLIRPLALYWMFAGALLGPTLALADLCTEAGLPATTSETFLGFGAATNGGNAFALNPFHVTSLAASGPGTLAEALSQGNRYVVFDVTGTIALRTGLLVKGANLTIDGCSAPAPGITLHGAGLYLHGSSDPFPACPGGCEVHDIIVRNLRVRNAAREGSHTDGFRIAYGAYNIVLDHVSAARSADANIDITERAHNVTVSWSIFAHPASTRNSLLAYQPSSVTMHHNLFLRANDREPAAGFDYEGAWPDPCYCPATPTCEAQCQNPTADPAQAATTLDFWNNVIWHWGGGRGTIVWYHAQSNILNNYYRAGRAGSGDNPDSLIVCSPVVPRAHVGDCFDDDPLAYAWAHVAGNFNPNLPSINTVGAGRVGTAFPGQPPTDTSACSAAQKVLSQGQRPYAGAGAVPLDEVDQANIAAVTLLGC
jgi:hypothetical protein